MVNTPTLHTERLILRRFTEKDAGAFFEIMGDPQVSAFLPWFAPESLEQAEDLLRKQYLESYTKPAGFRYAICSGSEDVPIGCVKVDDNDSHDLGYALKREYWHQGMVTEACRAVVEQVREAGIPYLTATHDVDNPRSGNVMKSIGMTYRYSYEEQWQPKNRLVTFRMYQLNFDGSDGRVYRKYWDTYPVHFIESGL